MQKVICTPAHKYSHKGPATARRAGTSPPKENAPLRLHPQKRYNVASNADEKAPTVLNGLCSNQGWEKCGGVGVWRVQVRVWLVAGMAAGMAAAKQGKASGGQPPKAAKQHDQGSHSP